MPACDAGRQVERPWIADFVHTPAAQDFAPNATRKRPLIFVCAWPPGAGRVCYGRPEHVLAGPYLPPV